MDVIKKFLTLDRHGERKETLDVSPQTFLLLVFGIFGFNMFTVAHIMCLGVWWVPTMVAFVFAEVWGFGNVLLWLYGEPAGASPRRC